MRRPDLVRRLVLIGQYYNPSGRSTAGDQLERMLTSPDAMPFLRQEYDAVSPDGPEHFATVYDKIVTMVRTEPEIDLDELRSVTSQTLVLQGDRDIVTLEHSSAVAGALADGRLAVLPGSHALPVESPILVNALLNEFLAQGAPQPALSL